MRDALGMLRELRRAIEETEADLASMPFFVRPMVKRGFARRTGRGFDDWKRLAGAIAGDLEAGRGSAEIARAHPSLRADLERLADNYRTAPDRAARGMGGNQAALRLVRERSEARERVVREVLAWLSAP